MKDNLRKMLEIETLKSLSYDQINDLLNKLNNKSKELKQLIKNEICRLEHNKLGDYYTRINALEWVLQQFQNEQK